MLLVVKKYLNLLNIVSSTDFINAAKKSKKKSIVRPKYERILIVTDF